MTRSLYDRLVDRAWRDLHEWRERNFRRDPAGWRVGPVARDELLRNSPPVTGPYQEHPDGTATLFGYPVTVNGRLHGIDLVPPPKDVT